MSVQMVNEVSENDVGGVVKIGEAGVDNEVDEADVVSQR